MFKLNIYLRFALIAVLLIGGIALSITVSFWYALPILLAGIVLLVGYIMLGTVQSAAEMMQTMDFEAAEKRLDLTLTPKLLYTTNKAFYYMLKGTLSAQRKDMDESEEWLKKAKEVNVPTDNEKAMIELQLANIHASKGRWKQAKNHFRIIKQLNVTEATLKEQIAQFDKALKQQGQMKAATRQGMGRGGMMRPGGKRRRPKMR